MTTDTSPASASLGTGAPVVAVDLGGTTIKSTAVTAEGSISGVRRTPTPVEALHDTKRAVEAIADVVRGEIRGAAGHVEGVGIVVPGIVDEERGVAVFSENLGWSDLELRDPLSARLGLPVVVSHDVRAAAHAERRLGVLRETRDALMVVVGTGVSGAVLIDGRLHVGGGMAGEFGHVAGTAGNDPCVCGRRGCLETVASAAAIGHRFTRRTGRAVQGSREVFALARDADPDASRVIEDAVDALAQSIASAVAWLAPEVVALGGGLSAAGASVTAPLATRVADLLSYQRLPRIVPAALGPDAGAVGSALLARDAVRSQRKGTS